MQKPDDIPEDVGETAVRIAVDWAETQDAVDGLSMDIARAILADRKKRAAVGIAGPVRHSEDGAVLLQAAMNQLNRAIGK